MLDESNLNKESDIGLISRLLYDKLHDRPWDRRCPECSSSCVHGKKHGVWKCPDKFGKCIVSKIYCDNFGRIRKIVRYDA